MRRSFMKNRNKKKYVNYIPSKKIKRRSFNTTG